MKAILISLTIFISYNLFAQEDITGFRGVEWGTTMSEMKGEFTKSSNKVPPYKGYDKKDDHFDFEGIKAHSITYGFKKEVFLAVNIGVYNKDFDTILTTLTKKYGEPKVTDLGFIINYEWHLKTSSIGMILTPNKADGKGVAIGISKRK